MPLGHTDHTAGQSHAASVVSMLAHCLRHLVSVAVLGLLLLSGALPSKYETLNQCCFIVGPTFKQLCIIVGHVSWQVAVCIAVLARQVKALRVKVYC